MHGIERGYCQSMVESLLLGNQALLETTIHDVINPSHVPLKGDTFGLDQRPENAITYYLDDYDPPTVIIAEERGEEVNPLAVQTHETVYDARTFYVCNPCDRSTELCTFIKEQARTFPPPTTWPRS